jgi:hypothetical protein
MSPLPRLAVAAALALSLAGCVARPALPKFRAGAPVEVEKRRLHDRAYRQDGQEVDLSSLLSALEGHDASSADARSARRWATGATALIWLGGAAALGYLAVDDDDAGWAVAGAAAGSLVMSVVASRVADGRLERAVRSYNGTLAPPTAQVVPWAGTIRGAQDRCVAAGVAVRF